jgi:hypothetical protein
VQSWSISMISNPHRRSFNTIMLCAVLCTGAVFAQDKKAPEPARAASAPTGRQPAADLLMAERLARYGDQMQDALALIVAARIKQETGERAAKREFQTRDGQGAASVKGRADTSVQSLIARARTMAKGRADVIAFANEVESSRPRGRIEGPHISTSVIRGGATNTLSMQFEGGTRAVVGISGDGATDLDLYVVDEGGQRVCAAEGNGDDEICRFTPHFTATYRVEIKNLGKIANQYLFVSN